MHAELVAIDAAHEGLLYAPPAKARAVQDAFDRAYPVAPPRSWSKEEWPLFAMLPWGVKQIIVRREAERDRALKITQNETANLRNKLKRIENAQAQTAA